MSVLQSPLNIRCEGIYDANVSEVAVPDCHRTRVLPLCLGRARAEAGSAHGEPDRHRDDPGHAGVARRIRRQYHGHRDGSARSRRQRAAARREGIPLALWDLERPLPPPERNAAPLYEQLARLLNQRPLDGTLEEAALRLGSHHRDASGDVAAARKLLLELQDVLALVHQATDRPFCVFQRDWSLGPAMDLPKALPRAQQPAS